MGKGCPALQKGRGVLTAVLTPSQADRAHKLWGQVSFASTSRSGLERKIRNVWWVDFYLNLPLNEKR